jgi:hypothetical protein
MTSSKYYYLLFGMICAGAVLFLGRDFFFTPTGSFTQTGVSFIIVFVLAATAGSLLYIYFGYRKTQKRDAEAALARRLMANPQFRDAILKGQMRSKAEPPPDSKPDSGNS